MEMIENLNDKSLIPNPLSCLLFEDAETKRWVAHCLEFDLVTSGKDEDAAWANLKSVVKTHVEHCFTNWQKGLKQQASADEFALFALLKERQKEYRSEKISFNLVPPQAAPLVIASSDGHYTWTVASSRLTCSAFADPQWAYALKCIPKLP